MSAKTGEGIFYGIAAFGLGLAVAVGQSGVLVPSSITTYTQNDTCRLTTIRSGAASRVPGAKPTIVRSCTSKNVSQMTYKVYPQTETVIRLGDEGPLKGELFRFSGCIIAKATDWSCPQPYAVSMTDGQIADAAVPGTQVGWWRWQLRALP